MAESLNRARLATSPMNVPYNVANQQSQILLSGVVASAPLVALAYSFAVVEFEGNATHAGNNINVAVGDDSVTIVLDRYGYAELSLLPFIRKAVLENDALENPLYCDSEAIFQQNNFRGGIDVVITEDGQAPIAMHVDYIFGNYAPKGELVTDVYMDYDANGETWVNVDSATNYNANGLPVDFEDNWCDINKIVDEEPSGDFVMPLDVAWYYGKDDIVFSTVNYHFRYDCRSDRVLKVRWLDQNGNINTRKFTLAGRAHGGSTSSSWRIPHNVKEISLGYDRGRDEWADITATESVTIGDDSIPIAQYDWLKTIASSAAVDAYIGGVWVRTNVSNTAVECDPRKAIFSITLTLSLPADDVQQF